MIMKKQTSLTVALLIALGALAACSAGRDRRSANESAHIIDESVQSQSLKEAEITVTSLNFIGEEKAKELAVARAGIALEAVDFKKVELDEEDGVWKYEVEFVHNNIEYDAEVNAANGEILLWKTQTRE